MMGWIEEEKLQTKSTKKIYKEKGRLKFQTALCMGIGQMSDYICFLAASMARWSGLIKISTRRFCARPSTVALEAIG